MARPMERRTAQGITMQALAQKREFFAAGPPPKKKRLFPGEKALSGTFGTGYERLISIAFCSMASAVVTALLLDWKPRWVMIMLTISVERSTLEPSML